MFSLSRATAAELEQRISEADALPMLATRWLAPEAGLKEKLPAFFAHDKRISELGRGEAQFAAAKAALSQWAMFDLGWVRVANPSARIELGAAIAVEAQTMSLWTLNISRITEVENQRDTFGFIYKTTALHVEEGEERFLIRRNATGAVMYELEAVSRPRAALARLGYLMTRRFQRRFSIESHARMQRAVLFPVAAVQNGA